MIEARELRKVFGPIEAVKGVSFAIERGEALGFLGPNGAGKSTVMRMLTCFLAPTGGTALVGGHDIQTDSLAVRRMVGYLPESNPVYSDMTPVSFLRFVGRMRGFSGAQLNQRVDAVLEQCWLDGVHTQTIETLSKGYKRRVGLAQALIHDPEILILDEPTDGLDPNQKHEVRTLIREMAARKCIIVSTHILEEVDAVCTRAIIIAGGRIVADETPARLKMRSRWHGALHLDVRADGGTDGDILKTIEALPHVDAVETDDDGDGLRRFTIFPKGDCNLTSDVLAVARERGWAVESLSMEQGRLNEVFRTITRPDTADSTKGGHPS